MQGILCTKHSIGYLPLPKVANTSIKHTMYELENGRRFTSTSPEIPHIHQYFRMNTAPIDGAAFRFVVIRDPIKRFLSAYANRVIHHKELSESYIRAQLDQKKKPEIDMDTFLYDPDLGEFIDNLANYQKVTSILVHTRPLCTLIADLGFFTKVYPFESLPDLVRDLSKITEKKIRLRHAQSGGPKISLASLSAGQLEKLRQYFHEDYQFLKDFYSFEKIEDEWSSGQLPRQDSDSNLPLDSA